MTVGGLALSFAEAGRGGRPLLLVHGFTGAKEDFTEWLGPLGEDGWHAVAVDLRGHGASDQPDDLDAYTWDAFAVEVLAAAETMWGDEPFVLLGHSMGGMIAQEVALRRPDRLAGLVLMGTGHGAVTGIAPPLIDLACAVVAERGIEGLMAALAALGAPDGLSTTAHRRVLAERPGYADYGDRKLRASAAAMYRSMLPAMFGRDDRLEALGAGLVGVPTLVVVGEFDRGFLDPSRRLAGAIAGAALAVVPDAGHSPQFENPTAWWQALSGFLRRLC